MSGSWRLEPLFTLRHALHPFDWLEALKLSDELFARLEALMEMEASLLAEVKAAAGGKSARDLREALRLGTPPPSAAIEQAGCESTIARYEKHRAALGLRYLEERRQLRGVLRDLVQKAGLSSTDRASSRTLDTAGPDAERQLYLRLQMLCARPSFGAETEGRIDDHRPVDLELLTKPGGTFALSMGRALSEHLVARLEAALELSAAYGRSLLNTPEPLRLSTEAIRNRQIHPQLAGIADDQALEVKLQLGLAEVTNGGGARRYELWVGRMESPEGLPRVAHAALQPAEGGGHLPRLGLGGAVYQRERWEVRAEIFEGLADLSLLLEVRRQAHAGRWPRFVVARAAEWQEPTLLDTRSPFAVEVFGARTGGAQWLTFEELYPAPDQLWLRDRQGRYASELWLRLRRVVDQS